VSTRARSSLTLALLLAACTTRSEAGSAAPGAASAAAASLSSQRAPSHGAAARAPADSPFHVALVEADWRGGVRGPRAAPCPVRGRTLVCGGPVPLVSSDVGVDDDPPLAAAMGDARGPLVLGAVATVSGRWPDDAWMLTRDAASKAERTRAYRWTEGRWAKVAGWNGAPRFAAPYGGGLVVDARDDADDARGPTEPWRALLAFVGPDGVRRGAATTPLTAPPTPDSQGPWLEIDEAASVDGTLFAIARLESPPRLMVERWSSDRATFTPYELAPRAATAHLWTKSARDVVAYGGATRADELPVLRHFDGDGWTALEPPPGVDVIVGYDRSASGTERVFAFRGEELSCWERANRSAWRSLPLPAVADDEVIDGHWVTDDDAWLHVSASGRPGRLLRLRPLTHVYVMGGSPSTELARLAADHLPAASAKAPPALVGPTASSLFHDAVIGGRDAPDSVTPGALRLCPVRGRTFVCGVSDVPLVSTEVGVVNDVAMEEAVARGKAGPLIGVAAQAFGAWPDDTWLVTSAPAAMESHAYRYESGAWAPFATWHNVTAQTVARSESSLLVTPLVHLGGDGKGGREYPLGAVRASGTELTPASTRVVAASPSFEHPVQTVASAGDALFVVATYRGKLTVERRRAGATDRVDPLVDLEKLGGASAQATLWAASPEDAVLFGQVEGWQKRPVLQRFDGKGWSAVATPPGVDRVAAYDRSSRGIERVVGYAGERLSLFERRPDAPLDAASAWQPVPLPAFDAGEQIREAWLANDDAWLLVWPKDTSVDPPRLMRMQPVARVWTAPRRLPADLGW